MRKNFTFNERLEEIPLEERGVTQGDQ